MVFVVLTLAAWVAGASYYLWRRQSELERDIGVVDCSFTRLSSRVYTLENNSKNSTRKNNPRT